MRREYECHLQMHNTTLVHYRYTQPRVGMRG